MTRLHTETYPLTKAGINRFITQLEGEDQVAVEVTANIYYFYDQVKPHASRVVLVDTYRFAVIAQSKKTDKADAASAWHELPISNQSIAGDQRHQSVRDEQAVDSIRRAGDFKAAVE